MSSVTLTKLNETFLRVDADMGIINDLSDIFVYASNVNSFALRKTKGWDGKIRLLNKKTGEFPLTMVGDLVDRLKKNYDDLEINVDPALTYVSDIDKNELVEWCDSLNLVTSGNKIKPYWYQYLILYKLLTNHKKAFSSATSSGKSLSIYLICRFLDEFVLEDNEKILIIVPSLTLLNQFYNDFKDYSTLNGFDVEGKTHKISAGADKHTEKRIVISTWQSIKDIKGVTGIEYFSQYGCVLVDEAQSADAAVVSRIIKSCRNAFYKGAFTGTFKKAKTSKLIIKSLFGDVVKIVSAKEIQESGQATKVNIVTHLLKYPEKQRMIVSGLKYQQEIEYIINHDGRNKYIYDLTVGLEGNSLLLFHYVEKHGHFLYKMFKESNIEKEIYYIHGKKDTEIGSDDSARIKEILESNTNCILIGSYGTVATGYSIKNLHNIVSVAPFKSEVRTAQSVGRGMRLHESKEIFTYHDIIDDFTYNDRSNYTLDHGRERVSNFSKDFKIKFKEANIQ